MLSENKLGVQWVDLNLLMNFCIVFCYHSMSMDPSAKKEETCKLQTRHWVITEENGKEQIVDGPGVIGKLNLYLR